jgi:hypothetical protein
VNQAHDEGRREYLSYLLRLWQVSEGAGPVWRALLRQAGTEEVVGFAGLEELFAFLRAETGTGSTDRAEHD